MKKKPVFFIAVVFLMLFFIGTASATIIATTQDVNIQSGDFAGQNNPHLYYLTVYYGSNDLPNAGLIQFDLSTITEPILSATLNLYHLWNTTMAADFGLYLNTSSWDEYSVTWNSSPTFDSTPFSTLSVSDNKSNLWRSVDITSMVNAWVDGTYANYGLRIQRIDQQNPYLYFAASSYPEGDYGPYLEIITSTPTVPEPSTMLLLGFGLIGLAGAARKKMVI